MPCQDDESSDLHENCGASPAYPEGKRTAKRSVAKDVFDVDGDREGDRGQKLTVER